MKGIPQQEQPYEKCWKGGPVVMSDAELLSVFIGSGTRGESALELSRRLLNMPGLQGLNGINHMSFQQLMDMKGIGKVKAIKLKCLAELSRRMAREQAADHLSFNDPETIARYCMEEYRHEEQEVIVLLMLDTRCHLLGEEIISRGSVNASVITPREVFLTAFRYRAVSVILLHNHPSGDPTPSEQDLIFTRQMAQAGSIVGIELLDHIIIGDHTYCSFRNENLL